MHHVKTDSINPKEIAEAVIIITAMKWKCDVDH